MIEDAEEGKRRALAEAEANSARVIEITRKQIQEEVEQALAKAKAEAEGVLNQLLNEAYEEAKRIKNIPEERIRQAIALVVKAVKERWQ